MSDYISESTSLEITLHLQHDDQPSDGSTPADSTPADSTFDDPAFDELAFDGLTFNGLAFDDLASNGQANSAFDASAGPIYGSSALDCLNFDDSAFDQSDFDVSAGPIYEGTASDGSPLEGQANPALNGSDGLALENPDPFGFYTNAADHLALDEYMDGQFLDHLEVALDQAPVLPAQETLFQPASAPDDSSNRYPCDFPGCRSSFGKSNDLKRHYTSVHSVDGNKGKFKCSCGHTSPRRDNYVRHHIGKDKRRERCLKVPEIVSRESPFQCGCGVTHRSVREHLDHVGNCQAVRRGRSGRPRGFS
ncbi:hypothetical protein PG984_006475 [Apiospora sp. TS-2023a]